MHDLCAYAYAYFRTDINEIFSKRELKIFVTPDPDFSKDGNEN